MTKPTKKNIFDILIFGAILLFILAFLISYYPLINDKEITISIIEKKSILPAIFLLLIIIIKVIAGEFIWLTNAFNGLDGLPLFLLAILIILIIIYAFDKDKEYLVFAKYLVDSFIGAFTQQTISTNKKD